MYQLEILAVTKKRCSCENAVYNLILKHCYFSVILDLERKFVQWQFLDGFESETMFEDFSFSSTWYEEFLEQ